MTGPAGFDGSGFGWRYDTLHMEVDLQPEQQRMVVTGRATLRLVLADSSNGPSFLLRRDGGSEPDTVVQFASLHAGAGEVTLRDAPLPGPLPGLTVSSIRRDEPFGRGETIDIDFVITGEGVRDQFALHPDFATVSWTCGWYPAPLPGPGEGLSAGLVAVTGEVAYRMPSSWTTVSCGDRIERSEDGDRACERWRINESRAVGFAAGEFETSTAHAGERTVTMYRLSADPESLPGQARALGEVIDAMAARFGAYPYRRFSIAEVPDHVPGFWAASEQGFILAKPTAFDAAGGNLPLFAHEAAHAWWGGTVGADGPGLLFLTESMAQYGAVVAIESILGEDAATEFLRFSRPEYNTRQCARGYFDVVRSGEDSPISATAERGGVYHTIADAKGHWVLHMLRRRVGDEVFFAVLRSFVDDYAGRELTLPAFCEAFAGAAPAARLDAFFEQWLDRTGAPVLDLDWQPANDDAIDVTLTQRQSGSPYDLDLEIEMSGGTGPARTEIVTLTERTQTFQLESPHRATVVRLDPHHRVLRWTPEYGSRP
ncbi:MAG: M1 family aminopeptidase [Acidimicrobiia bacterium]|nr:M1 family aminopeptidase [Acidimicrobiia bacterium]